ncbi:MAG: response regulator transcription factor [bacterium]
MVIRLAIIEDNAPIRKILSGWIQQEKDFELVAAYPDAEKAVKANVQELADVVLVDINMPGMNGIECVRLLKPLNRDVNYVMLTAYHDAQLIFDALSAGAGGYLLKRATREELMAAIKDVHSGGSPMSSSIARIVVEAFQNKPSKDEQLDQLSTREHEVLDLLSKGMLYKEIADQLNVKHNTVHTLVRRIYEKLQVHTRREAINRLQGKNG